MTTLKKTINFLTSTLPIKDLNQYYDLLFSKDDFNTSFLELFNQESYLWLEKIWNLYPEKKEEFKKIIISNKLMEREKYSSTYYRNYIVHEFSLKNDLMINQYLFENKNKEQKIETIKNLLDFLESKNWLSFKKDENACKNLISNIEKFSKLKKEELKDLYFEYLNNDKPRYNQRHLFDMEFFAYLVNKYEIENANKILLNKYLDSNKISEFLPVLIKMWQKIDIKDGLYFWSNLTRKCLSFSKEMGEIHLDRCVDEKQEIEIFKVFKEKDFLNYLIENEIDNSDYQESIFNWLKYITQKDMKYFEDLFLNNQKNLQKTIYLLFDNNNIADISKKIIEHWDFLDLKGSANFFIFLNNYLNHATFRSSENEEYCHIRFDKREFYIEESMYRKNKKEIKKILIEFKSKWLNNIKIENEQFSEICSNEQRLELFLLDNNIINNRSKQKISIL